MLIALSLALSTSNPLPPYLTILLTSLLLMMHLFVRKGTRSAGYLRYPEHLVLAFLYELYLFTLALTLAIQEGKHSRTLLTAFFYVTPLLSLAVTLTSVVASIQAYYRVKEYPLAKSG